MTELRECPFCGCVATLSRFQPGPVWACGCDGCEIGFHGQKQPIVSAWNRRADAWHPIETAPRDGTEVLVYATMPDHLQWADPDKQLRPVTRVTAWHPDAGWCVDELREASHWRPLPKGPGG